MPARLKRPRRAQPDRYPDLGFCLAPAFPAACAASGLLGVRHPLQWRNRPRFTRGSLSSGCEFKRALVVSDVFKERPCVNLVPAPCQAKTVGTFIGGRIWPVPPT